jgi:hypothetical protein
LRVSLDEDRLNRGGRAQLTIELINAGTESVSLAGADHCNPALQLIIWNKDGGVAWAPGLPLCERRNENAPPTRLAVGKSISAKQCFTFASRSGGNCAALDLPPGAYEMGGTFYGLTMPSLALTLAP